jgi:hypothetical protein
MNGKVTAIFAVAALILLFCVGLSAQERWLYLYDGPASGFDAAVWLVEGADGNLYGAGWSPGVGSGDDLAVASLTTSGVERWVYRYNGPGNDGDGAWSIDADGDGNVYAAGYSIGVGTGLDLVVVSLDTWGAVRWVYRYDGPASGEDRAYRVAVGTDGNVYAVGISTGIGTGADLTVISLTPQGDERWIYRLDGPASDYDEGWECSPGPDGNFYVMGGITDAATGRDFIVISFASSGDVNWLYTYDGPASGLDACAKVVAAANGNIYATGYSEGVGTNWDMATICLNSSGEEQWVHRFTTPGDSVEVPDYLTVGLDGNIYASGVCGAEVWQGGPHGDLAVVSISPEGETRWVYRYNGPGNGYDEVHGATIGPDGNWYGSAACDGIGTFRDLTVLSVSPSGWERWVYVYDGTGHFLDYGFPVVVDEEWDVYAAGFTWQEFTLADLTIVAPDRHPSGKAEVLMRLENVLPTGDSQLDRSIEMAIADVEESLEEGYWVGRKRLDPQFGHKVFDAEKSAAVKLLKAMDYRGFPGGLTDDLMAALDVLVDTDKLLALTAVGDAIAAGCDPDELEKAEEEMAEGEAQRDDGKHHLAIDHFKRAWEYGMMAMKKCGDGPMLASEKSAAVGFALYQNNPNPFARKTAISFNLPVASRTALEIYDTSGRLVETLVDTDLSAGVHSCEWDRGSAASGVYFYRLNSNGHSTARKMVVVR